MKASTLLKGFLATMVMGFGIGCSHHVKEREAAASQQAAAEQTQGTASDVQSGTESVDRDVEKVAGSETGTTGTSKHESIRTTMSPLSGSGVSGEVTFTQEGGEVLVSGNLRGLEPNSEHGIHIHSIGVCSGDGSSAGDHFDPRGHPHGALSTASHIGDLGNVTADEQGNATFTKKMPLGDLKEGPYAIAGRALIVHSKRDDLRSQPSGNSGDRIACGVIGG